MPFSSFWAFVFLVFIAPGVVFQAAFSLGARTRRSAQSDAFSTAVALFMAALAVNIVVTAADILLGARVLNAFADIIYVRACVLGSGCAPPLKAAFWALAAYGVVAILIALVAGLVLSKLIAWGLLPVGFYYGPLYTVIRGFFRHHVLVTVVSRLTVLRSLGRRQKAIELPIMYRGLLDEIRLSRDGKVEYVAIESPSKGVFIPPEIPKGITHAADLFTEIGKDEKAPPKPLPLKPFLTERLVIESADIQNVYFLRVESALVDKPWKIRLKTRVLTLLGRRPAHAVPTAVPTPAASDAARTNGRVGAIARLFIAISALFAMLALAALLLAGVQQLFELHPDAPIGSPSQP